VKTTTVPHEGPWNGRRIGKVEKQREAKDYIRAQEEDLIGLVETKVRSGKAARITRCLGKDCSKAITVENEAGNGRIWLIWNMYKHLIRECALTHSILIERFRIRRNEVRSARYSFIIQTDAPLSQSSGLIVQSIIRTGNRKWPEWLLWVECSSRFS